MLGHFLKVLLMVLKGCLLHIVFVDGLYIIGEIRFLLLVDTSACFLSEITDEDCVAFWSTIDFSPLLSVGTLSVPGFFDSFFFSFVSFSLCKGQSGNSGCGRPNFVTFLSSSSAFRTLSVPGFFDSFFFSFSLCTGHSGNSGCGRPNFVTFLSSFSAFSLFTRDFSAPVLSFCLCKGTHYIIMLSLICKLVNILL